VRCASRFTLTDHVRIKTVALSIIPEVPMTMKIRTVAVCLGAIATLGLAQGRPRGSEVATFTTLPALAGPTEALATNEAGTAIAGSSWGRDGLLHAVKWTLQADGSWGVSDLPWPAAASSTIARAVNNRGDVAGNDFPSLTSHPLLWLAGTSTPRILGCSTDLGAGWVYGISAETQTVVGEAINPTATQSTGAVWRPDGTCREELPLLVGGGPAAAYAVNGDGTIIGGGASGFPVRWTSGAGQWRIERLDARRGLVFGANDVGDLTGYVETPCGSAAVCQRAVVWYTTGESRELGTLGGADSWARDINSNGEVVGSSSRLRGANTGFFWSPDSVGMVQLPFKGRWGAGNALSEIRPDGTRLVVGLDSRGEAVAWVVRNP
jgi:uncharacterized membrane protein